MVSLGMAQAAAPVCARADFGSNVGLQGLNADLASRHHGHGFAPPRVHLSLLQLFATQGDGRFALRLTRRAGQEARAGRSLTTACYSLLSPATCIAKYETRHRGLSREACLKVCQTIRWVMDLAIDRVSDRVLSRPGRQQAIDQKGRHV